MSIDDEKEYARLVAERLKRDDADVLALCERLGFGFVMDSAARQWAERDPRGALTAGPIRDFPVRNSE